MSVAALETKSCCARAYSSEAARYLLGESFHPGGAALTAELARALCVGPGDVVVDIASGPGTSALQLAGSTGCAVVGIDVSVSGAAAAAARAREAHQPAPHVRFACGDAEALPLADASVDGALCECAFCLFPDKPAAAREIARVLRPGARLALSDVTAERARLSPELRTLDAHVACLGEALPLDDTAGILAAAGLVIESVQRRDDALAPMLERIEARLRLARLIGDGPLAGVLNRADRLLEAAQAALRDGSIGYGVVVARRTKRRLAAEATAMAVPRPTAEPAAVDGGYSAPAAITRQARIRASCVSR